MKITLVGIMGSGKTTVGKLLAKSLNLKFVDLDHLIESYGGGMPIQTMFDLYGEQTFRIIERIHLKTQLSSKSDFVLATGGGTPVYCDNMDIINKHSISIFLDVDFQTLWHRIQNDSNRPLAKKSKDELLKLYQERLPFYRKARIIVDANYKDPQTIVKEIQYRIENKIERGLYEKKRSY